MGEDRVCIGEYCLPLSALEPHKDSMPIYHDIDSYGSLCQYRMAYYKPIQKE